MNFLTLRDLAADRQAQATAAARTDAIAAWQTVQDKAEALAVLSGVAAVVPGGQFAAAFGGTVSFVSMYLAADKIERLQRLRQCFAFSPAAGVITPYLVASSGSGHLTISGQQSPSEFTRNPPDFFALYSHCSCVSRLGEDQARMGCLANPWGPDDSLRQECLRMLREDAGIVQARLGACSLMTCPDIVASAAPSGQCGCPPANAIGAALPSRGCLEIDCADGATCGCNTPTSCRCQPAASSGVPGGWVGPPPPMTSPTASTPVRELRAKVRQLTSRPSPVPKR
jgi:hypothetical protein